MRTSFAPRLAAGAALIASAMIASPASLHAQMPGAPVFQNAFSNPGLTAAFNYARGDNVDLFAAAVAFAPGTGRFQFSGGIGAYSPEEGDRLTALGGRVGVPLFELAGGRIGVAPFVGIGRASRDSLTVLQVPLGLGAGWRTALGATRALSVYVTGTGLYARREFGELNESDWLVRAAIAADVTIIPRLGLTVGYEGGRNADPGEPGPTGGLFGAGVSWAFR